MGVIPGEDQGPGKAKMKIDKSNTHMVKATKGKKLKPGMLERRCQSLG
jgi:DNA-binding Xre family transcriptional regulator